MLFRISPNIPASDYNFSIYYFYSSLKQSTPCTVSEMATKVNYYWIRSPMFPACAHYDVIVVVRSPSLFIIIWKLLNVNSNCEKIDGSDCEPPRFGGGLPLSSEYHTRINCATMSKRHVNTLAAMSTLFFFHKSSKIPKLIIFLDVFGSL